jgi:hypothetical protein
VKFSAGQALNVTATVAGQPISVTSVSDFLAAVRAGTAFAFSNSDAAQVAQTSSVALRNPASSGKLIDVYYASVAASLADIVLFRVSNNEVGAGATQGWGLSTLVAGGVARLTSHTNNGGGNIILSKDVAGATESHQDLPWLCRLPSPGSLEIITTGTNITLRANLIWVEV